MLQVESPPATTIESACSRVLARLQETLLARHKYRKSMHCNKDPEEPKLKKKNKKKQKKKLHLQICAFH